MKRFYTFSRLAMLLMAIAGISFRQVAAEPALHGSNSTATGGNPVPARPEPKEYVNVAVGAIAVGNPLPDSFGSFCWPIKPKGSMTINGGGGILLDGKGIPSLILGDSASKKAFEWTAAPAPSNPPKKKKDPATSWACNGGAQFQTGFAYPIVNAFQDTTSACGSPTVVAKPATVSGGVIVWHDAPTCASGTLFVPKIKTVTSQTAPSNPNAWRKKIGVGEQINCILEGAPEGSSILWTTTITGGCTIESFGYVALFRAGDKATTAVITATYSAVVSGQQIESVVSSVLTIVAPVSETVVKDSWGPPPPAWVPRMGAGMTLFGTVHPTDVSFSNIESKEVSGPASNRSGMYADTIRFPFPDAFDHLVPDFWFPLTNNSWKDAASLSQVSIPWSAGGFEWDIPVRWRVIDFPTDYPLPNRLQRMEVLDETGTVRVSKMGQTEQQTP